MMKEPKNNSNKWHPTSYYLDKYAMKPSELMRARQNGLPYIVRKHCYYYNENDFHRYYAGLIGNDVEKLEETNGL